MNREELASLSWRPMTWVPTHWLIHKVTGLRSFHLGEGFDGEVFSVGKTGDHDHCALCHATFSADPEHLSEGFYNDDEGWMCASCHGELGA